MNPPGAEVEAVLPLSPLQHGMVFHDVLDPAANSYVGVFRYRLHGPVEVERFADRWRALVGRHQALRASFRVRDDGTPEQLIWKGAGTAPVIRDLRQLSRTARDRVCASHVEEEKSRGFDLAAPPLIRVALFRLEDEVHELIVANHHIVLDGWSLNIVLSELFGGAPTTSKPYADVVRRLARQDSAESSRFWRDRVGHICAATPLGIPAPTEPSTALEAPSRFERTLSGPRAARVRQLARQHGLTLNTVFTGAWALVLSCYSGDEEVVLGVTTSGRSGGLEGEDGVVGLLINTIPVPVVCPPEAAWSAWSATLQRELSLTRAHEATPLVDIARRSAAPGGRPMFDHIFVFQNYPAIDPADPGLRIEPVTSDERVSYPLALTVEVAPETMKIIAEVLPAAFDPTAVERLLGHLEQLLVQIAARPDDPLGSFDLLPPDEKALLEVRSHPGLRYNRSQSVLSLIEAQAVATPGAVAVTQGARAINYAELVQRSRALARQLAARGVGLDVLVPLCLDRSPELLVGMLGVLMAGGAYVPLEPDLPAARRERIVRDCRASLVLGNEATRPFFSGGAAFLSLDPQTPGSFVGEAGDPGELRPVDDLAAAAYVIFTSGSTGTPRGVVVTHANLAHVVAATRKRSGLTASDRCLQFCSPSFDSSVTDIFGTLASGGTLVLPPWRLPDTTAHFEELVCDENVTVVDLPTAYWHYWVDELHPGSPVLDSRLRLVMVGGEACRPASVARWNALVGGRIAWANNYGPTETTVNALGYGPSGRSLAVEETSAVIGTPYGDATILLLDRQLRRVPTGVRGEIYVGGPGVARGYLALPAETDERFLASPFDERVRLYRTGDLARHLADGNLEYLGRSDDQIKIRGYRVEPREVEGALLSHPAVRQATVVARAHPTGQQLMAYVVARGQPSVTELRAHLLTLLPDYFLPAAFVLLDQLPLTSAGKVDRAALPAPAAPAEQRRVAVPPTAVEEIVAGIWAQVLGLTSVGTHENFFELGGHSLLAMQVVSRMRTALHTEVPLRSIFACPTVAQLAGQVSGRPIGPPLLRRDAGGTPRPLSYAQQRLWFVHQLEPTSALYNVPVALQVSGPFDVDAFIESVELLSRRHAVLRSTFRDGADGPVQVVTADDHAAATLVDLTRWPPHERPAVAAAREREAALAPFDLSVGPIWRCIVLRQSDVQHRVIVNIHHIACDAWSFDVLLRDLAALYAHVLRGGGDALPDLPVEYADYAEWQRKILEGPVREQALAYWGERLRDAPSLLELPTDSPRPAVASSRGGTTTFWLDAGARDALLALSRGEGATLYMALLAAFCVLMSRSSGQDDLVVASPVSNRSRLELEGIVGCFVNLLPLRIDVGGRPTFTELLRRVRDVAFAGYEHQELPFDLLVEHLRPERTLSHASICQVMCTLDRLVDGSPHLGDADISVADLDIDSAKWDLALHLTERSDGIEGLFSYRLDLFRPETIKRMVGHFTTLLGAALSDPNRPVAELPLLSAHEEHQLRVWNDTRREHPSETVVDLVAEQVLRHPDAVAAVCGNHSLTYAELGRRSDALARELVARGVGRDAVVAVALSRTLELPIAILAVGKAGAAYLPVDPGYPLARQRFMIEDSRASIALLDGTSGAALAGAVDTLRVDQRSDLGGPWEERPRPGPRDAAYVIYTSGSTGLPRGVVVEQHSLTNHMRWMLETFPSTPHDVVLLKTPLSFDASTWEIWLPLVAGATLAVAPVDAHRDPRLLIETIQRQSVTTLQVVPSILQALLDRPELSRCSTLRRVFCGGEPLPPTTAERFLSVRADWELINLYGTTETTIDSTYWRCRRNVRSTTIPIGRPISNTTVRILDQDRRDVPIGVVGELHVGGEGLARGYLNAPGTTARRFWATAAGDRFYATGDLARYLVDGSIAYVGRNDDQVKLHGVRIEPGETESVLLQHPAVRETAVTLWGEDGAEALVAHVAWRGAPEDEAVKEHLTRTLPAHLVPSRLITIDALPLTLNGKLDRGALEYPVLERPDAGLRGPSDDVEDVIAAIWRELLGVEQIAVDDNFFDLGGHSLLALKVLARTQDLLQASLALSEFVELPTIAGAAAAVRRSSVVGERNGDGRGDA